MTISTRGRGGLHGTKFISPGSMRSSSIIRTVGLLAGYAQVCTVLELAIFDACNSHNLSLLRLWGRQGVRLRTGYPLPSSSCACIGSDLDVIRFPLNDLGANVNQADQDGVFPWHWAVKERKLDAMRCLI
jgi:hypothetical protein